MSDVIDKVLAEAPVEAPAAPEPEKVIEQPEATEAPENEAPEVDETPFPKKAVNAITRRDKQIAKLRNELNELRAMQSKQVKEPEKAPSEAEFNEYGEFVKAQAIHEYKLKQQEQQAKLVEQQTQAKQQEILVQQASTTNDKISNARKSNPMLDQVFAENDDVLNAMPDEFLPAFFSLEAPEAAIFALAKEGKLEALASMTPYQAAIELGRAELRGTEMLKSKPVTKAPAPIRSVNGTNGGEVPLHRKDGKDLLKWLNS